MGGAQPRAKGTTPWGPATILEELRVPQRAGAKRYAVVVQLLETGGGEPLIRVAYTTGSVVRRGPVTLRIRDIERMWAAVSACPALAAALGLPAPDP